MFYLPLIWGDSSDTPNGVISAAASKQQKTQERKLKKKDVLVLWPGQIEVVKFDTPSPDDIALERRLKPYTRKQKSYRIDRRLNQV